MQHRAPSGSGVAVALLLLLAMIAAACGGSGEETTGSTSTIASSPADGDETPETLDPAPSPSESPTEIQLTASYKGVTPEVIKVGVLSLDFEALAAAGVNTGRTNVDQIFIAALEAINDRGGVHGRTLEFNSITVLPVGPTSFDEACVKLTEDDPVFVVVGSTARGTECFTELNETAVIAVGGLTESRSDRATAPYATVTMNNDTKVRAALDALIAEGAFEGQVVGLAGAVDVSKDAYTRMADALTDSGIDFVDGLVQENDGDVTANQSDGDVIRELFDSSGVTLVVNTSTVAAGLQGTSDDPDPTPLVLVPFIGVQPMVAQGIDLDKIDGALSVVESPVGTTGQPLMADDPLVAACVANAEERTGETIPYELDTETSLSGAINSCSFAALLEAALLNAGPDLTYETFQAGLDAIGDIDLPGYRDANISADSRDAAGSLTVVQFDSTREAWVPAS